MKLIIPNRTRENISIQKQSLNISKTTDPWKDKKPSWKDKKENKTDSKEVTTPTQTQTTRIKISNTTDSKNTEDIVPSKEKSLKATKKIIYRPHDWPKLLLYVILSTL
jgi:hypothetical protein